MSSLTPSVRRYRYMIWAEEAAALSTGNAGREWSYGNGDVGNATDQDTGVTMLRPGRVIAMSFQGTIGVTDQTQITLEINRTQVSTCTIDIDTGETRNTSDNNVITAFVPVFYAAGDHLSFATTQGTGSSAGNRVIALVEE